MASIEEYDAVKVNNQTWNKLCVTASKSGYREGLTDGRESNFQTSFDEGFHQGFKNGFVLGIYKGVLSSTQTNLDELMIQKTARGNCIICKSKELENNTLVDLTESQTKDTNNILIKLYSKYSPSTSVKLLNEMN